MALAQDHAPMSAKLPLAVDLDGTLIRGDLFSEAILRLAFEKPWKLPELVLWLLRGRAYAKARLAEMFPPDVTHLPYDERVVDWARAEEAAGRIVVLATASDQHAAQAVADHLGMFERVFASDGKTNLKSQRKGEALAAAYPDGFCYAGNEMADIKVWRLAKQAVVCNASKGFARNIGKRFSVERTFESEERPLSGLVRALRPQHWAKNILVFVPLLTGQAWWDAIGWALSFGAFMALCFTASAQYLVNDAADIAADRRHPRKRNRPFASGALSPFLALPIAAAMFATGLWFASLAHVLPQVLLYVVVAGLYTFWLKRLTLVDVFVLASLYMLRMVIGGDASGYYPSQWLLAFASFFFLSLALVKRAAEVDTMKADLNRRGYRAGDGPMLKRFGVAAGMISALLLALYLQQPENIARYAEPAFLWALPAVVTFWLARVWLKVERGEMHDDPLMFAVKDPMSWFVFALGAAAFVAGALA